MHNDPLRYFDHSHSLDHFFSAINIAWTLKYFISLAHQVKTISGKKIMKIVEIDTPAAGTWARDCELICLTDYNGFNLSYHREEDDTYWHLHCSGIVAYKVNSEEFWIIGYLKYLPTDGAFFEILDSPWISEFGKLQKARILDKCKHYVLMFYDEVIEIIAQDFVFEQLKEKPIYNL